MRWKGMAQDYPVRLYMSSRTHHMNSSYIFLADSSYPYYLVSITAAKYIIAVSSVSSLQNVGEKASFRLALVYLFNNYEHSRTL